MSDGGVEDTCPLCCEDLDVSDKNFMPCACGYFVCMWCVWDFAALPKHP